MYILSNQPPPPHNCKCLRVYSSHRVLVMAQAMLHDLNGSPTVDDLT